jgi:hypothetical protein
MSKAHENLRLNVVGLLRNILKRVVGKRLSVMPDLQSRMLLDLLDSPEITILMTQEVYASSGEKKAIDMMLGNSIVFEIKSTEGEFDQALNDAKDKYWNTVSKAKYYIITNYSKWRIYDVSQGLALIFDGDVKKAEQILENQIIPSIPQIRIYPLPNNVAVLYQLNADAILKKLRGIFNSLKNDKRVKPLFEAYKSIMKMLYGDAGKSFFEDLFIRHTYMHISVIASLTIALDKHGNPEDICGGSLLATEVALPYLNWWKIALREEKLREEIQEILNDVITRAGLVDWSVGLTEDVFRVLYEILIEPETRRKLGEYYTPLWMVDLMLNEFNLKEKTVLDPFCGSGTFLTRAFHRKVDAGEDVDKAFESIIGYDVNPLAISVTRAELIIAYYRRTGREPDNPPLIYHVDTLAVLFEGELTFTLEMRELKYLMSEARRDFQRRINFMGLEETAKVLKRLREIERALTYSIRFSYSECKLNDKCLGDKIQKQLEGMLGGESDDLVHNFLEHFKERGISRVIAKLIRMYEGNDVWGVVLISIYVPLLITMIRPDIIVTNPPWIPTTEYKAPYIDKIKDYMLRKIREGIEETQAGIDKKAAQIYAGADISAAALGKSIILSKEGVAYIMNREQLFYHKIRTLAGIVATYRIISSAKNELERFATEKTRIYLKLFDIDFDAFQHGIYPAIVIIKKNASGEELYVISISMKGRRYDKSLDLNEMRDLLKIRSYEKNYEEYIKPGKIYFSTDLNELAKKFNVLIIVPKGLYIMGAQGGEKKKGKERYAGLALESYSLDKGIFRFRLYNTKSVLEVPQELLEKYNVNIYRMIYTGEVNPFKLRKHLDIILSKNEEKKLKEFLDESLSMNERRILSEDDKKIRMLISELKQPSTIQTLNKEHYYAIYRARRCFTAFTYKPNEDNIIVREDIGYLECNSEDTAYYYSAVLNYLAYRVTTFGGSFIRNQYAKPLLAVYFAGLSYDSVRDDIRKKVVELSKVLHEKASDKEFSDQSMALKDLYDNVSEFRELVKILDSVVDRGKLEEALDMVSGAEEHKMQEIEE